jgi:selenoprotein W-related protein
LAEKILTQYKQQLVSLELQPSRGGCFELTIDGELVYSKLAAGEFPDEQAMVKEVGKRLP